VYIGDPFEGMWNASSDWDEKFWARNLQMPLGVGVGTMEGNFVMETGTGI